MKQWLSEEPPAGFKTRLQAPYPDVVGATARTLLTPPARRVRAFCLHRINPGLQRVVAWSGPSRKPC
jgi:hypothetical protein